MQKGDLEKGMLNQCPTLNITSSICYQVREPVDKVKSRFIQSAWDNIAELYNIHHVQSDTEHLQLIDSFLADNKFHCPIAEHVDGGVHGPNPMQRVTG
jgi:hypothetical protein